MITIWVDADACPKSIQNILFRVAVRKEINTIFVSNQFLTLPPSPFLSKIRVESGPDVADKKIVSLLNAGDLVITADIPLADAVINKGGFALNPRGEFYTEDNIKHRLAMRNLMSELRESGLAQGGPPPLSSKDLAPFANALDRFLAKI